MRVSFRFLAAVAIAVLVSNMSVAAAPRDRGTRLDPKIVKVIKQLQKIFGVSSHTDAPMPPRPTPPPAPAPDPNP